MNIIDQLKRDEGVKPFVYNDPAGIPTIGVGRNLRDVGLSNDEIGYLLANDVKRVTAQLSGFAWFAGLDPVRQGVLINMCFNLGISGLLHFPHMLSCLAVGDWSGAAAEMHASRWAVQVGDRATRLMKQMETGEWQ